WEQIRELTLRSSAPCLIYEEGSLIKRAIRDLYNKDIDQVLVEGEGGYREAKDYMKMLMPSHAKNVQQYGDTAPLFIRYQVESYLNGMFSPTVQLKSGGYIVIGVTEALVAIDVNSGRSTREGSIEDTAVKTNLEAADEIARQLRLRDLAGLIVIDFIDMDEGRNNRAVEKRMKERLKSDRARIQVGRISAFGLMEMSRQRLRPGMLEATTRPCPHCHGQGFIRSDESMALSILREIEEEGVRGRSAELTARLPVDVSNYIVNWKRDHLAQIEGRYGIAVQLVGDPALTSPEYRIEKSKQASRAPLAAEAAVTATSVAATSAIESDDIEEAEILDAAEVDEGGDSEGRRGRENGDGSARKRRRGKRGGRRRKNGVENGADSGAGFGAESDGEAAAESVVAAGTDDDAGAEDGAEDGATQGRRRRGRGRRDRDTARVEAADSVEGESAETDTSEPGSAGTGSALGGSARGGSASAHDPMPVLEPEASDTAEPADLAAPVDVEPANVEPADVAPVAIEAEPTPEADPVPAPSTADGEAAAVPEPALEEADAAAPAEPAAEVAVMEGAAAAAEPEEPSRPKRRGWWSLRR
ncbi:MAG: ribonuclease E/G, partial [Pseudomonadota bacterium]